MMDLLVFLVLLFGLFGVISGQYIIQYREAYALWINTIVYDGKEEYSDCNKGKRQLCSKLESYSRELCALTDMIQLIFILLSAVFLIIVYTIEKTIPLIIGNPNELNIIHATRILTFFLFCSLFIILYFLKINLLLPVSKTSAIDEKIFEVWYELKCDSCKKVEYRNKLEPNRLYERLAEKIDAGEIKPSQEELTLLAPLLRKKNVGLLP